MNLTKLMNNLMMGFYLSLVLGFSSPVFGDNIPRYTEQSTITELEEPINTDWLPDVVGLPDEFEIPFLTQLVEDAIAQEQDAQCNAVDRNLRILVLQNYVFFQHMANAQGHYFKDTMALKYAHILAMILQESSGDPTNVTDMSGRSITTYKPVADLQRWKNLLKLVEEKGIVLNEQTNFGLTQLSADRLFVAFSLASEPGRLKDFLEGEYGDATPNKVTLNTASAIRRLIWFYQDIAQGRIAQNEERIAEEDIYKPEFYPRFQMGLKMALIFCGTRYLYGVDAQSTWENKKSNFEKALASIAYCKLGDDQTGFGTNQMDEQCFVEWVTLCPALNMNIALLTPLSYFQSRNKQPVCIDTFKRLLNKGPEN
ncbi:hypothetical protein [Legionella worsleiensis]|uniref:Uncharacterized protein n=1 Tax=Legionella worsleiensis TaxID=45076 RepID=A0A0W1AJ22_9GAMM|nr:hypothetical protein [Legionella worsleiensis]KTD81367.1 hypothetical protein Lwor_0644 [Legionella worsleiensis]STY29974.1 Uncharacterised protein [Legionella worsleiensis]